MGAGGAGGSYGLGDGYFVSFVLLVCEGVVLLRVGRGRTAASASHAAAGMRPSLGGGEKDAVLMLPPLVFCYGAIVWGLWKGRSGFLPRTG